MKTKICYFSTNNLLTPIPHMRLLGPSHIEDLEVHSIKNEDFIIEKMVSEFQLFIIDRDAPRNYHRFKEIIKLAHMAEIPIVYDIDDYLLELPENHPDRAAFIYSSSLLPTFEALLIADYVTVSTEKLKGTLKNFNRNIHVLPNFLDDSLWPFHLPIQRKNSKPITIGYMGGESHKPDVEWITPVLEKINEKFLGEINFYFYGVKPPEKFLALKNVNHTNVMTYNYKEFINNFHNLGVDIFIAPLIDNLFNECKSPIKYLEYSTMGVPGVFSDIEPYQNVVANGKNGFLAKSQDDWFNKLVILIQNPDLRYKFAKYAQETVRSNWLMSENAHIWTDTYNKFIQMGPQQTARNAVAEIIDSISSQLHDFHRHQTDIIAEKQTINKALEEKEVLIQTLNEQLSEQKQVTQSLSDELLKQGQVSQNLQNQVAEKETSNKSLSNKLSKNQGLLNSLNKKLSMKDKELSSLYSQLTEKEHIIDSLRVEITNKSTEVSSHGLQLEEKNRLIKQFEMQIENQNLDIELLKTKLSEMEEEILFYSLSKSWLLTRPLRKIMSLFKGKQNV